MCQQMNVLGLSLSVFSASASDNGEVLIAVAVGRVVVFSTFGTIAVTYFLHNCKGCTSSM